MLRHRTGRALGLRGQRSQPFAAGPCGARSQHADERASKTRLFHMTAASEAWCKARVTEKTPLDGVRRPVSIAQLVERLHVWSVANGERGVRFQPL